MAAGIKTDAPIDLLMAEVAAKGGYDKAALACYGKALAKSTDSFQRSACHAGIVAVLVSRLETGPAIAEFDQALVEL